MGLARTIAGAALLLPLVNGMAISGGNIFRINEPVHETITLSALMNSNYHMRNVETYYQLREHPSWYPEINDFVRGAVWNDDPACLLFDEGSPHNLVYSEGIEWAAHFKTAEFGGMSRSNVIGRSHFGDLQFLHAMASSEGESPLTTKGKILMWMEIAYKLAVNATDVTADVKLGDVVTSSRGPQLGSFFDAESKPSGDATLRNLLDCHHHSSANIQHRALGSCFHLLQDSYALGHTRRELLNPKNHVHQSAGETCNRVGAIQKPLLTKLCLAVLKFDLGSWDRWGAISKFHTYRGQSSAEHAHYDHAHVDMHTFDPASVDVFDGLVGVRAGIEACIELTNFWLNGTAWEQGVQQWLSDEVFELATDVSGSDRSVD